MKLKLPSFYRRAQPKIFCIGWHKTGTMTMWECLKTLGFHSAKHIPGPATRRSLVEDVLSGRYDRAIDAARQVDAVRNWPWPLMFEELDQAFAKSKFILTLRSSEGFIKSVTRSKCEGFSETDQLIYNVETPLGNEKVCADRFERHNLNVQTYFRNRPNDLLILDFEKSARWEELCDFLGKPVPFSSFPHLHKGGTCSIDDRSKLAAAGHWQKPT